MPRQLTLRQLILTSLLLIGPGCVASQELSSPSVRKHEISASFSGSDSRVFPIGFGSGLALSAVEADGSVELLLMSDRGPNASAPGALLDSSTAYEGKFFLAPEFTPQIGRIKLSKEGELLSQETIALRADSGKVSGLIPPLAGAAMPEEGLSLNLERLDRTPLGFDPEGITTPRNGTVWLADEYRPGLVEVELASGTIKRVLTPGEGLPEILSARQPNRGFEGVAITPSGKLVAVVQSTLDINGETKASSPITRLVVVDLKQKTSEMYAYAHEATHQIKDVKIGDITAISDTEFILVHAEKTQEGETKPYLVAVSTKDATPLRQDLPLVEQPEYRTGEELAQHGIVPVKRRVLTSLAELGWDYSKTEGLALLPDGHTLIVANDNDFGTDVNLKLDIEDLVLSKDGELQVKPEKRQKVWKVEVKDTPTSVWFLTYKDDLRSIF